MNLDLKIATCDFLISQAKDYKAAALFLLQSENEQRDLVKAIWDENGFENAIEDEMEEGSTPEYLHSFDAYFAFYVDLQNKKVVLPIVDVALAEEKAREYLSAQRADH